MQARGFSFKILLGESYLLHMSGLSDGQYFIGLAGILLLIFQRPVKGRHFENQCLKLVL